MNIARGATKLSARKFLLFEILISGNLNMNLQNLQKRKKKIIGTISVIYKYTATAVSRLRRREKKRKIKLVGQIKSREINS